MTAVAANNITIEYDTFGNPEDKPILMIMGLGAQMIAWDDAFCEALAATGHFVIRYDNRDVGLTSYFDQHGVADLEAIAVGLLSGEQPALAYTLDDMANDGMCLLAALGIDRAHICGASLGGMIAQAMAINHPSRVLSLTSIMSTTGNPLLPPATVAAMEALTSPREDHIEHAMQRAVDVNAVIGSPGFPRDEARLRARAKASFERAYYPAGVSRQMAAVMAHGDRRSGLNQLTMPALIIHGADDPLVPMTGGLDTHENIRDAHLLIIDGMGHDLPQAAWPEIVTAISEVTEQGLYVSLTTPDGV